MNNRQCLGCKHSEKQFSKLHCVRPNPQTGEPIAAPSMCNTQRTYGRLGNFLCKVFAGYDLCGKQGKYFEPIDE